MRRGNDRLPRQGTRGPWKVRNDYVRDVPLLTLGAIDDGILHFGRGAAADADPDEDRIEVPSA